MKSRPELQNLFALLRNLLLAYGVYMLCRLCFVWENWTLYAGADHNWWRLFIGGLLFDSSAIAYTLALYIVLMLLPASWRYRQWWQRMCRWLFVVVNGVAVVANLVDAVYSQYTGRRTTSSLFSEFSNENNLGGIVGVELLRHWYLVLAGVALIAALWFLYKQPRLEAPQKGERLRRYLAATVMLLAAVPVCIIGMRGGASYHRPIAVSDASRFVQQPQEANIVLNTPFAMLRTIGSTTFTNPAYFTPEELDQHYSPLHTPTNEFSSSQIDTLTHSRIPAFTHSPNIVILILESFGQEYFDVFNPQLSPRGYTPFLDSLAGVSLTFSQSFGNGRKSIDAMPSILSSIPMFVEPYILTRYANNRATSVAGLLRTEGYRTAFFHGADNGSMGFQAFANATGFEDYYGMTEYCADPRHRGMDDFDGNWAIWDEEFLQYYGEMLDTLPQPFCTALFTASSHHPYNIPDRYRDSLRTDGHPMYTCIRYSDHALRRFFAEASKKPWFQNTLFVITADHTNHTEQAEYQTALGQFRVPILFFDPSGRLPRGRQAAIAQQIDIMPTLLSLLGYDKPYIAFGKDLLANIPDSTLNSQHSKFKIQNTKFNNWAVNYNNGIYQYVRDSTLLQFDGSRLVGRYNYIADPLLQHNQADRDNPAAVPHLDHLKAIIQSYMQRMIENRLTYDE